MRFSRALLVIALLTAACTSDGEATSTTADTGPTTTVATTATTRPQLVDGGLVLADPATLIPFEDAEPIIVGMDHRGTVSQDLSRTVVQTSLSDGSFLVSVLETNSWEVLSSVDVDVEPQLLTVDDAGAAYWLGGPAGGDLLVLEPGADAPRLVTSDLLGGFDPYGDQIETLADGGLGLVGSHTTGDGDVVSVVILSPDGEMTVHDLPALETRTDINGDEYPVRPDYAWDTTNNRVLVVEATRDVVNELDLESGDIDQHPWDGIGPATQRDVVLSPDGARLFVASAGEETKDDGLARSPQDLVVLDTVDWASGEIVDIAVDHLYPSPDNQTLLAQGAEVTTTATGTEARPSPVYLLDMTTAEVSVGFQVSDSVESPAQYSADGAFAYLATDEDGAETYAILDVTIQELVGTAGFNRFSLIGPAALVAFHQQ